MKKIKNILFFIVMIVIIISIYFALLNNIMDFTLDYEGQLLLYENKYEVEDKENRIRQYIEQNQTVSNFTEKEINSRILEDEKNSKKLQALLNTNQKELSDYIKNTKEKKVIEDTKYGDIICINSTRQQIVFTYDFKDLYYNYSKGNVEIEASIVEDKEDMPTEFDEKRETILKEINQRLKTIELIKEESFVADSVFVQRYLMGNSPNYHYLYLFEDKTSGIQVTYDVNDGIIKKIIVGFE